MYICNGAYLASIAGFTIYTRRSSLLERPLWIKVRVCYFHFVCDGGYWERMEEYWGQTFLIMQRLLKSCTGPLYFFSLIIIWWIWREKNGPCRTRNNSNHLRRVCATKCLCSYSSRAYLPISPSSQLFFSGIVAFYSWMYLIMHADCQISRKEIEVHPVLSLHQRMVPHSGFLLNQVV